MLFSSPIFSQASGSIAGLVFAHGRAGMTVRSKSTPTNPNTARQRNVRHALAVLAPQWGQTLSAAERDAWNLYAANVTMTNALGQTVKLTGQNHFLRTNIPRIQSALSVLATAPTVFDLGNFTAPTIDGTVIATQVVQIGFDNTDAWANVIGGAMLVYIGRPTGPGQDFFRGGYRFGEGIFGFPGAPASPASIVSPWRLNVGNQIWVTCRVTQLDGRLSLPIILGPHTIT